MSSQPLQDALDALRVSLQAELDAQRTALDTAHAEALATARQEASAADARWARRLESAESEWAATLAAAEKASADAVAANTASLRTIAEMTEASRATPPVADVQVPDPHMLERLAMALPQMTRLTTLSSILDALQDGSTAASPDATLVLVNGSTLQRWRASASNGSAAPTRLDSAPADHTPTPETGPMADVIRRAEAVSTDDGAALPLGIASPAHLVPVTIDGQCVAIVAAPHAAGAAGADAESARAQLHILAAHASACLMRVTAMKLPSALATHAGDRQAPTVRSAHLDDGSGARRYARLLVSEIKLYNEPAVRAGRAQRDLLLRLGPEIARARRLFEERVPASVADRSARIRAGGPGHARRRGRRTPRSLRVTAPRAFTLPIVAALLFLPNPGSAAARAGSTRADAAPGAARLRGRAVARAHEPET